MSIQRAVGQSMHTAAALYTQTPQFKEKLAAKRIAQQNLIKKMQEANKKVVEQQEAKKLQRRNFLEYLKKEPSSFGKPIGEVFSGQALKQLAAGYSRYERKKLMDAADKAKGGKNGVSKR